jgi:hypothetical protein
MIKSSESGGAGALLAALEPQRRGDFRHDRHGDFGRADRTYIETDRRMNAGDRGVRKAQRPEPLDAFGMRLARA